MEPTDFITIGPASRLLNISPEYLRILERKGIVRAKRTSAKVRLFLRADIERLKTARTDRKVLAL